MMAPLSFNFMQHSQSVFSVATLLSRAIPRHFKIHSYCTSLIVCHELRRALLVLERYVHVISPASITSAATD